MTLTGGDRGGAGREAVPGEGTWGAAPGMFRDEGGLLE